MSTMRWPWSTTIGAPRMRSAPRDCRAIARRARPPEYLEAVYSDLHDTIHRPARRTLLVLLSLMRDRVPAAMSAMRVHLLGGHAAVRRRQRSPAPG